MTENCGKSNWLYNRIFNNKTPIDIAFIGTSKTICGIQDSVMEMRLLEKTETPYHVANLAFCRFGRPLHFSIAKDLFLNHQPLAMVIEVRETESRFNHPDFAFIANRKDILTPYFHQSYFKKIWEGGRARIDFQFRHLTKPLIHFDTTGTANNYSYFKKKITADPIKLEKAKTKNQTGEIKNQGFNWEYHFPEKYLSGIIKMADRNRAAIYFLYLPSYGSAFEEPYLADFYKEHGTLLIPPKFIFENKSHWSDDVHL